MAEPKKIKKIRSNQKKLENLKLKVKNPEKLTYEDINNPNIYLINRLKSIPNTISIPSNWKHTKRNLMKNSNINSELFNCGDLLNNNFENNFFYSSIGVLSDELKVALNVKLGDKLPWFEKIKFYGLPKMFVNSKLTEYFVKNEPSEIFLAEDSEEVVLDLKNYL